MIDETLETAAYRKFVVSIRSKPGLMPTCHKIVTVEAHSILKAKQEAVRMLARGKFQYRREMNLWVFDSVEPISNIEGVWDGKSNSPGARSEAPEFT